jgi:transcriptional regulator with GAF, ATPase, and Fis domain
LRGDGAPGDGYASAPAREPFVVEQPSMAALNAMVLRIAAAPVHVLICGETGVGKELVAEALHRCSPRNAGPFVRINCAALPEPLMESELFGHERGAFSGATSSKAGLIEAAHGGTVLLDEVGALSAGLQAKLLRITEENALRRIGALREQPVEVRFVSATNRDMEHEVSRGAFRADLFFRLNWVTIDIPPLRHRPADIQALAHAFVERAGERMAITPAPRLTPAAIGRLLEHPWPGNVRELRNVIDRAVLLTATGFIEPSDLRFTRLAAREGPRDGSSRDCPAAPPIGERAREGGDERQRIVEALQACHWNQTRAATVLGMPRRTLVSKLGRYGIPRPRKQPW